MIGSLGGSIYSGNVVRMFGKAGSTLGMAAGGEAAGSAGKAAVSAEEETAVVQRAATIASEKTFTLPGDIEPQCFVAGTLIVTESGDKPIEDIKVGDKVYSENEHTGERGFKRVTRLFVNAAKTLVHLIINGTKIDTTEKHPFWVIGKGWVKAGNLKAGNKVSLKTGEIGNVDSVEVEELDEPVKVYNFEVEDWHTYFVSDIGVLVHNKCWVDGEGVGNTKPKTWNEFESANAGKYDNAGMSEAWKQYKDANGIVSGSQRSQTAKSNYLRELGESGKAPKWMNQWLSKGKVPPGYAVDHKVPLSIGGEDIPSNMRLLDESFHKLHHSKGFYRPWQ